MKTLSALQVSLCSWLLILTVTSALKEHHNVQFHGLGKSDYVRAVESGTMRGVDSIQEAECMVDHCLHLPSRLHRRLCTLYLCLGMLRVPTSPDTQIQDLDFLSGSGILPSIPADDSNADSDAMADSEVSDLMSHGLEIPEREAQAEAGDSDKFVFLGQGTRGKRWQDADPLQVCIQTHCPAQRGVFFYTCVYHKCIARGVKPGGATVRRSQRRRR